MNKIIWFVAGLLACVLPMKAQVDFRQVSFAQAVEQAKAEKKPIFMDCQTKWCGSCKVMAREVFSKQEVGTFFNDHFVNVLMDMESPEGKEVNKLFKVNAYPTFFIFNTEGKLQHRIVGARSENAFLELVKKGMRMETSLQYLDSLYKAGKLPVEVRALYVEQLNDASFDKEVRNVCMELFERIPEAERTASASWYIYENMERLYPSDEIFAFLVKHKAQFDLSIGDSVVDKKISEVYQAVLREMRQGLPKDLLEASYEVMPSQMEVMEFADKPLIVLWLRYNIACMQKDTATLLDIWEHHLSELPFLVQVQIPFGFAYIVESGDKDTIRRYVQVGEKLLPYLKEEGFRKLVKQTFEKYKEAL